MVDVFLLEYSKIVFSHILVANNWSQAGDAFRCAPSASELKRSLALQSSEHGRGSGIRLSARRRANKRMEQTLRVVK